MQARTVPPPGSGWTPLRGPIGLGGWLLLCVAALVLAFGPQASGLASAQPTAPPALHHQYPPPAAAPHAAVTGPAGLATPPSLGIVSVQARPDSARRPVAGQVQLLEDPGGQLGAAQVLRHPGPWRHTDPDAVRLGSSRSAFWLRLRLQHAGQAAGTVVLDLASVRQDHVRWVVADTAGRILLERDTGERLPRATRLLDAPSLALPLALAPGEVRDVYVRLRSHDGLFEPLPIQLSGEAAFHQHTSGHIGLLALYAGALLALVIYNLFVAAATRAPAFWAYVTYGAGLLLWSTAYHGLGFQFLWPGQPVLNHQLPLVGGAIAHAGAWWFIPRYLRLQERPELGWTLRLYRWSAWANLSCAGLGLADQYTLATHVAAVVALPAMATTVWLAVRLAREGQREARFLGPAFGALLVGLIVFYLQLFGWAPYAAWAPYTIQIGSFIEMTVLAFGLADSMNALKAQKLAAEQQALAAQRALARNLEHEVAQRTRALEAANRRLGELAVTDELTGAYNRRRFNADCARLAAQQPVAPLALAMFDLDHFKRYNDRYGHQAGDAVLRRVAREVGERLADRGELYRLGGEEFGVLMQAGSLAQATAWAEDLRLAIEALAIPHDRNPAGRVTASVGVLFHPGRQHALTGAPLPPATDVADAWYAGADAALYRAKAAGRNRVAAQGPDTASAAPVAPVQGQPA